MSQFDLKKFLVENKLTSNSRLLSESDHDGPTISQMSVKELEDFLNIKADDAKKLKDEHGSEYAKYLKDLAQEKNDDLREDRYAPNHPSVLSEETEGQTLVDSLSEKEIDNVLNAIDIELHSGRIPYPRDESEYDDTFENIVDYLFSIDYKMPWPEPETDQEYDAAEDAIRILASMYMDSDKFDPDEYYRGDDGGYDDPSDFYGVDTGRYRSSGYRRS